MGATGAVMMGGGSLINAYGAYQAGRYNEAISDYNSTVAGMQRDDAIVRGEENVVQIRRQGKQIRGAQRVAMAAQGVDVNQDSSVEVQADTARAVAEDVIRTRNNARREAWGYQVQSDNYDAQARAARFAGTTQAIGSILGGGGQTYFAGKSAGAW